jgi:CSLREA domain-containing protein
MLFLISVQAQLTVRLTPSTVELLPGQRATVNFTVQPTGDRAQVLSVPREAGIEVFLDGFLFVTHITVIARTDARPGRYQVPIRFFSGNARRDVVLTVVVRQPPPDLGLALEEQVLGLNPGDAGRPILRLSPLHGFSGPVNIRLEGAPAGVTLHPNPTTLQVRPRTELRQALNLRTSPEVAPGHYTLTLRASAGRIQRVVQLNLAVRGVELTLLGGPDRLVQGEVGSFRVNVTPRGGFTGPIELRLVDPPAGVRLADERLQVAEARPFEAEARPFEAVVRVLVDATTPAQSYNLTIRATAARQSINLPLRLTVAEKRRFTVDAQEDTIDADPGNGECRDANGRCSLRAAIMEANALRTSATVTLPQGTFTLSRQSELDEQGNDLDIRTNLTLRGAGRELTVLSGAGQFRVLEVHPGNRVVLEDLSIRDGNAQHESGGGIYVGGARLEGRRLLLSANSARHGGAIFNDENGEVFLEDVRIERNRATSSGGGINNGGRLEGRSLQLISNQASGNGGGLSNTGRLEGSNLQFISNQSVHDGGGLINSGRVALEGVQLVGNTTGSSGGGFSNGGELTLSRAFIGENQARSWGGGGLHSGGTLRFEGGAVLKNSAHSGGGLYVSANALLRNLTVAQNRANYGGGIFLHKDHREADRLEFLTIHANEATRAGGGLRVSGQRASEAQLRGVIISGNHAASGPECAGQFTSRGFNLISNNADCAFTREATDLLGQPAQLGALVEGGALPVFIPQPGSPALNRIPAPQCLGLLGDPIRTDALGQTRPQGAGCEAGAVEVR